MNILSCLTVNIVKPLLRRNSPHCSCFNEVSVLKVDKYLCHGTVNKKIGFQRARNHFYKCWSLLYLGLGWSSPGFSLLYTVAIQLRFLISFSFFTTTQTFFNLCLIKVSSENIFHWNINNKMKLESHGRYCNFILFFLENPSALQERKEDDAEYYMTAWDHRWCMYAAQLALGSI